MADRRVTEAVVLAEDLRSARLVQQTLARSGRYKNVRLKISPRADGSAEQWVRQQFPAELRDYRSARARRTGALVVHTDADGGTVDDRLNALHAACVECDTAVVDADDLVALLIPKWSVETWVLWLSGDGLQSEEESVKLRCKRCDARLSRAADQVHVLTRPGADIPDVVQPSFRLALPQWCKVM